MADLPREPITRQEEYLSRLAGEDTTLPREPVTREEMYLEGAIARVEAVEEEVERLENNPDVVDIVATYADLQAYDTSTLTDKDVIRVLADSTHNNNSTFYRWNAATSQFDYIGEVTSGPTVVQTTGSSTTDVMSQDATTKMVYQDYDKNRIQIGASASATGGSYYEAIAIGRNSEAARNATAIGALNAKATANNSIAIGSSCSADGNTSIAIGYTAKANSAAHGICIGYNAQCKTVASDGIAIGDSAIAQHSFSVALGNGASTTRIGEINVGTSGTAGYQGSSYRVIGGVYDPQNAHDAATKGYVDTAIAGVGGGITKFYFNESESAPSAHISIYKDRAMTQLATSADVWNAKDTGFELIGLEVASSDPLEVYDYNVYPAIFLQDESMNESATNVNWCTYSYGSISMWNMQNNLSYATYTNTTIPTIVQTTGTSTTGVMSQNATTGMVYADPATKKRIQIGNNTIAGNSANYNSVAIGDGAKAYTGNDVVIGNSAQTSKTGASTSGGGNVAIGKSAAVGTNNTLPKGNVAIGDTAATGSNYSTAVGSHADAQGVGSIALGSYATTTSSQRGVMNIGTTSTNYGYSMSNYRLLTGLYDPQSAHDAATKGYIDGRIIQNVGTPTTSTVGTVGQLLEDITNGKLYICTDATNPYVWGEVGGGSVQYYSNAELETLWEGN